MNIIKMLVNHFGFEKPNLDYDHHDMPEKLLKMTLSPKQLQQQPPKAVMAVSVILMKSVLLYRCCRPGWN